MTRLIWVTFVLALAAIGAAAPAAAECTGRRLTVERPNATNFVCRANCGAVPNELLLARRDIYRTHDARYCMELCEERADCRAISFEFLYEGGEQITRCYLWREGELTTFDDGVYTPRMRQPGVCYRRWAAYRDPRFEIDTNRLGQDQMRPGVPGVPGPSVPKK
jgi:hypothetical protein